MSNPKKGMQLFGGDWTEQKLDVLGKYLKAYAVALKNQPFEKFYIDAFAGTGYREQREKPSFPELTWIFDADGPDQPEPQQFLAGSASIALRVEPAFGGYVFVESQRKRAKELEKLISEYPSRSPKIKVQQKDANKALQEICRSWNSAKQRGVLFLDPFGLQVDWTTVEGVAKTESLDTWILFPLMVNRLLTKLSSEIPAAWRDRLTKLFGTESWLQRFYQKRESGLFDTPNEPEVVEKRRISLQDLGEFYYERLSAVFKVVAPTRCLLRNKNGVPLYQLFFAAGNEKGAPIALKIAEHIIKDI